MANFEKAHKITATIEGGYTNNPFDKGGETYAGISRKFHPDWEGWQIIDQYKAHNQLKEGQFIELLELRIFIADFYKEKFWDINRLDEINDQEIAAEIYDTGVNMGTGTAAKMAQEALNMLNRNGLDFKDLKVDGEIGNITLGVINNFKFPKALLKTLNGIQLMRYIEICKKDLTQEKFFRGWLLRV